MIRNPVLWSGSKRWSGRELQAIALSNRAGLLTEFRRFDEATAAYKLAVTVDASCAKAAWNFALL
jgi:hypothetical protein